KGYQSFLKKQEEAKAKTESTGAAEATAAVGVAGKQTFETYCAACHGLNGKADGAAALAMNPKPRNFTDKAWQAKVNDEHIAKVIKEGGAAVGLSASMAPWGAVVNDAEIKNLVQYLRSFGH
ncbi:MAG: c-type cytochrome, partial [Proteobacteria bacterium]|nr:c-type cytochrome [Pseudomonadota bacterium]